MLHNRSSWTKRKTLARKTRLSGAFIEPSSGLEPETPSLPCTPNRNRSQRTATDSACFRGFWPSAICQRLRPVATTGLHKGSIREPRRAYLSAVIFGYE
jgi:hypothetical protein